MSMKNVLFFLRRLEEAVEGWSKKENFLQPDANFHSSTEKLPINVLPKHIGLKRQVTERWNRSSDYEIGSNRPNALYLCMLLIISSSNSQNEFNNM